MSGARELYVYYRVAPGDAAAAQQAVHTFQQRLREQHPGLFARVLRRSDGHGDSVTLMEIYQFDDGQRRGIGPALQAHIEAAATVLTSLLASPRQREAFDAIE